MRADLVEDLCRTARDLAGRGLVAGTGGNISVRDGDELLISARGADLATLAADACVVRPVAEGPDDASLPGMPSSELPLHRAAYTRPGVGAVVHTHSRFAIVMSTLCDVLPSVHYLAASLGGPIRVAPYARFGTDDLAEVTASALEARRVALMRNHGAVAVGPDLRSAASAAINVEWLAELAYLGRVAGGGSVIDDAEIEEVRRRAETWGRTSHAH